jgi:4-alpha-glucanotransferase
MEISWHDGSGVCTMLVAHSYDGANWFAASEVPGGTDLHYRYELRTPAGLVPEDGEYRCLSVPSEGGQVYCQDFWRPQDDPDRLFFSSAFRDVVFRRETSRPEARVAGTSNRILFRLSAVAIPQDMECCILGNHPSLGDWKVPLVMDDGAFPCWQASVEVSENFLETDYKYAICEKGTGVVRQWEAGENRTLRFSFPTGEGNLLGRSDEHFRYGANRWHGAGVAVPVFSLRSEKGLGIGEFADLKGLVDWSVRTGMRMVQVLPVNDTIATKTWTDSYPYAAISIHALHPLYIHLPGIATLRDKRAAARLARETEALNNLAAVDFERVLEVKFTFLRLLYRQERAAFRQDPAVQSFLSDNASWLRPYAAFCYLRDTYGTVEFPNWPKHALYSERVLEDLCHPDAAAYDEVAFHYFVQYHAHRQLSDASAYAAARGVVLKGDLPIGIYRYSCDAWMAPELYNMDGQAGAPPDPYADDGQNWGFPTYNWEVMARDGFAWWRQRMSKLSEYFHALRIDHILGFFRIWEIPVRQVSGVMGLFNPRLPYSRDELASFGLQGDLTRYTRPYIRPYILDRMFGEEAEFVRAHCLEEDGVGGYRLRPGLEDQAAVRDWFAAWPEKADLGRKVMKLVAEVLLIEEPGSGGTAFNPRITLQTTASYQALGADERGVFDRLYQQYYYSRHDAFWRRQAMWKLPALLSASDMLICGEDLGMIPSTVPGVMQALNILSLEIQRMPKGAAEFADPAEYPYTSVCSPSCHDMPTIRGWWEADAARAQRFLHRFPGMGQVSRECTVEVVEAINRQHLASPSMWAVFPIQDLVGMDGGLRRADAAVEQINDPSISPHYWRFRFHLTIERLLAEDGFNARLKQMVRSAAR